MSGYYSVDAILTDAQKVPCTFELNVPGLGYLDDNAGGDVRAFLLSIDSNTSISRSNGSPIIIIPAMSTAPATVRMLTTSIDQSPPPPTNPSSTLAWRTARPATPFVYFFHRACDS